jgi:hypothetical protein
MQHPPNDAEAYARVNTRKASVVTVGGFRPTGRPEATHFGLAPLGQPHESWPKGKDGTDLLLVCQLNLAQAPYVPLSLAGVELITFFVHPGGQLADENNVTWSVRAYATAHGLVPLSPPKGSTLERGFECSWSVVEDQPVYDDPDLVVPEGFDNADIHLDNIHRTKIGGYPSNIQSEPWWGYRVHPSQPRYCFQVDSEEKVGLHWGDAGTVYIARGTAPGCDGEWFLDWQCY